jgi:hypothetical protein
VALDPDPPPVQLHELLGQRQPESCALLLAGILAADLAELLEDGRLVLGRDPDARVADGDRDDAIGRRGGEADPAPLRGELDGIGQHPKPRAASSGLGAPCRTDSSELRLHGIATRAAANAFLPRFIADYNRRFARPPADPTPAWRRPPRDLPLVLSCRYTRVVARDNTVRLGPRWLQRPAGPGGRSWARCRVELRECLDGRLVTLTAGRVLATHPSPGPDFALTPRADPGRVRAHRLRASRSPSEAGGRDLPLGQHGPASPIAALTALAAHLRRPAREHPWRRPFSRRERARQRAVTPQGG